MKDNYCIYIHINKINNKTYIGQTSQNPASRWREGEGYIGCPKFYAAIQKYGWDNFEHIILKENLTSEEADYWECFYIKKYNSQDNGYNLTSGGKINKHYSQETIQKMKKAQLGNKNPMYGKRHSEQTKQKLRNIALNLSEEQRKKQSIAQSKKVQCIETGDVFIGLKAAAKWCGLKNGSSISNYCRGIKKSAGKHPITKQPLHWKYIDEVI